MIQRLVKRRGEVMLRRGVYIAVALLILTLLSVAPWLALNARAEGPEPEAQFVPGEVLVKFKTDLASAAEEGQVKKKLGLKTVEQIEELGVQRVEVRPGDEEKIVEKLQSDPAVEYAEPNYIVYAVDTNPDDLYFNPPYSRQWGLTMIQAPAAWDIVTGTTPVIIAILDTGVDLDHPDFSCPGKLTAGWDYANGDGDPDDDHGHGTHVAGIAAACTDNATGVAGLSWGARIMPLKVLNSSGNGSVSSVANGITHAANNGARVISMSLGGYGLASNQTLKGAVDYAYNQGCLLVAAAGNDNTSNPLYPAAYNHVVAVAATDGADGRAYFSNYGSHIDVAAPGVSIYSTLIGSYGYKNGTSMATPFVSGLAALVWSADLNQSSDAVEGIIKSTAVDRGSPGWDQYFGWGRINAGAAALATLPALDLSTDMTLFLADDDELLPVQQQIGILNKGGKTLDWSATISPTTPWLFIVPPEVGSASMSTPGALVLTATKPVTYGGYTATVVITSDTPNVQGSPQELEVFMYYASELYHYYLPMILKHSGY
jgi:thermitase